MSLPTYDVPVPALRHFQDLPGYCGAACAQMIIAKQSGSTPGDQQQLYVVNDASWDQGMTPDEVADRIKSGLSNETHAYGQAADANSRTKVMRHVAWSMCEHGLPAVALISGGQHWVVIDGLIVTVDAQKRKDLQPDVTNVFVRDPAPDLEQQHHNCDMPDEGPPPHAAGDLCGGEDRQEEEFEWAGWEGAFTRCENAGAWLCQWVALCAPEKGPCVPPEEWRIAEAGQEEGTGVHPWAGGGGKPADPPLDAGAFLEVAKREFARSAVRYRPVWGKAIASLAGCVPLRVQRLDDDTAYDLLLLEDKERRTRLLARLDARSHRLLHAVVHPERALFEALSSLTSQSGRLVWRPCRESMSPWRPFVEANDQHGRREYRLLNRRSYAVLTVHRRGTGRCSRKPNG